jgi:hypothetical protein
VVKKVNRRKGNFVKAFSIMIVGCLLSITAVNAQEGPDPIDSDCLDCETTTVPFDSGAGLLLVLGVGYGIYRIVKVYNAEKRMLLQNDEEVT